MKRWMCGASNGCPVVEQVPGGIAVYSTRTRTRQAVFTVDEFAELLRAVKAGELDDLLEP